MRLAIRSGARAGEVVEVTAERFVVGREADCDLTLVEEKVSRHHASLERLPDGRDQVRDLGSTNGTFVDGRRISEPVALRGGEELRFGDATLLVEPEPRGAAPTAVAPAQPPVAPAPAPPRARASSGLLSGRGKWIAAAAVAAGIAGLGTALGLILTGGGDSRTLLASAPEAVTVFVTAPAETGAPPVTETQAPPVTETEAPPPDTETQTEGGEVEPNDAELALFTHIPAEIAPCWQPAADISASDRGAVAAIGCDTTETGFVVYYQFDGGESLDAWYTSWLATFGAQADTGFCDQDDSAEGALTVGDEERGRLVCGPIGDARRGIVWKNTGLAIGAIAIEEGTDAAARAKLYEIWQTLGPVD